MKKKAKINRSTITSHLIEYQLDMVGKRLADTLDDDEWYFNWTMTKDQSIEFRKYSIRALKKVFKFNTTKANTTFEWFNNQFGLRIKD